LISEPSPRAGAWHAMATPLPCPARLLYGGQLRGTPAAREAGGTAQRWQVLTVKGNRITDIRGFDDRTAAAARAGLLA
jgi:hypothetical protein